MLRRWLALAIWLYAFWLVLTWTATAEQLVFGAILALAVAGAMAPLGPVVAPWRSCSPRRLVAIARLVPVILVRIVVANISLAKRIWQPSRPLSSGMIIVPTTAETDGELAATGLLTSLIVDNQLVDVDRSAKELQYHAVEVPPGDPQQRAEHINAPTERRLRTMRTGA